MDLVNITIPNQSPKFPNTFSISKIFIVSDLKCAFQKISSRQINNLEMILFLSFSVYQKVKLERKWIQKIKKFFSRLSHEMVPAENCSFT